MILENKQALYLTCDKISSSTSVYTALFAESANIVDCFVMANSLPDAVSLIYSFLLPKYNKSFIDSVLLEVKFIKRLDVLSYEC